MLGAMTQKQPTQEMNKLTDLSIGGSEYGVMIPQVYGLGRVSGNMIWGLPLLQTSRSVSVGGGTANSGRTSIREYSTFATFMDLLCAGPVGGIRRVWHDDELVWDTTKTPSGKIKFTQYLGTETQEPDPLYEGAVGLGKAPAHRGYVLVVYDMLDVTKRGNRRPFTRYEVGCGAGIAAIPDLLGFWIFETETGFGFLDDHSGSGFTLVPTPDYNAVATPIQGMRRGDVATTGSQFSGSWYDYITGQLRNYACFSVPTSIGSEDVYGRFRGDQGAMSAGFWVKSLAPDIGSASEMLTFGYGACWEIRVTPVFPPPNIRLLSGSQFNQPSQYLGEWFADFDLAQPNIALRKWVQIIWTWRRASGPDPARSRIYINGSLAHEQTPVNPSYDVGAGNVTAETVLSLCQFAGIGQPGWAVDEMFVATTELTPEEIADFYSIYQQ